MNNQQSKKSMPQADHGENPSSAQAEPDSKQPAPVEIGGPKGPEPTRYGDWEIAGRCSDF